MSEPNPPRTAADDLREVWSILTAEERRDGFACLTREEAEDFFVSLSPRGQAIVLEGCTERERRLWLRLLPPDDAADVVQEFPPDERPALLGLLDESTRREVNALMAYEEDVAGGLMSPRFARLRPDMRVEEAIRYLRRQAQDRLETIYYVYVLDAAQRPEGVTSFRELLTAPADKTVRELMEREVITVPEDLEQEAVARVIAEHDLLAVPVVDAHGRMKGIVTVDDVVDVVQREATEDIQKIGGTAALDLPYMQTRFLPMLKKRAGWLSILFLGEMLTANAMARYEQEIAQAVVLTLFVPLIISSGGNSGSQAATLVIRAMALGEVRLRDWALVLRRELAAGLALGGILAVIGLLRVLAWDALFDAYEAPWLLGCAVGLSLIGVVAWGTLTGSVMPMVLRRLGFDPASASAPFIATLVDVFGLAIYFNVALLLLRGSMA